MVALRERLSQVNQVRRVPLYANAIYLLLANAATGLLGFAFWITVARFYSPEDVGLASALIAAIGLLAAVSHFGLGMSLIRFLPSSGENASSLINTVLTISTASAIAAVLVFAAGLGLWSPALVFMRQNPLYFAAFLSFTVASALSILVDDAFIAVRRTDFALTKGLLGSLLKLLLPIPLAVFFRAFGPFASWGLSLGAALLVSLWLFLPRVQPGYRPGFTVNRSLAKDILGFSLANHVAGIFWVAPASVLPIMVVNLSGADTTAYFAVAWTIATLLFMVPTATSLSLFAEGSHDEERLGQHVWRSLGFSFLILVPSVLFTLAAADKLLLLFGTSYSENASGLLRILAVSAPLYAINVIYLAIKRVERGLGAIVGLTGLTAVVTLGLAYALLSSMGIDGVAVAWLAGQASATLVVAMASLRGGRGIGRLRRLVSRSSPGAGAPASGVTEEGC